MTAYIGLPVAFLRYWYIDAPKEILLFFDSLNTAFFQLFSLPLFLKTFFKPIKNEYRKGLVGFSLGMGIGIKTVLILFDLAMFGILLASEVAFLLFFLAFPILTIRVLFV
ncbi:MAG: hypothetical protein HY430_01705 [Candidatus Levybacteria bacterium]|nr:hypothetical protein [Candidatus Levybacteria bacterium]